MRCARGLNISPLIVVGRDHAAYLELAVPAEPNGPRLHGTEAVTTVGYQRSPIHWGDAVVDAFGVVLTLGSAHSLIGAETLLSRRRGDRVITDKDEDGVASLQLVEWSGGPWW